MSEQDKAWRARLKGIGIEVEHGRDRTEIKFKGLGKRERQELVNLLRKNFMYQQPRPVFARYEDPAPAYLVVRMIPADFERMVELARKAGGWFAPASALGEMAGPGGTIACPHGLDDWRTCRRCLGETTSREIERLGQVVFDPEEQ